MPDVVDMTTAGVGGGASLEDCSCCVDAAEFGEKHAECLLRGEGREGGRDALVNK